MTLFFVFFFVCGIFKWLFVMQGEAMVRRLEDLKRKILVGNQLDWANFKSAVTFVSSYVVGVAAGMCVCVFVLLQM